MKAPVIIAFVHLVTKGKSQVKKKKDFWAIIYSFKELKEMNSYPSNLIDLLGKLRVTKASSEPWRSACFVGHFGKLPTRP